MGALTQGQIIEQSLKELGVGAAGEPIDPEDYAIGQLRFNMMVDDFKAERLMIYEVLRNEFNVTTNTASFSIGPGGDWDVPTRPLAIVRAGFINTFVSTDEPLETPIHIYTDEEWAAINLKNLTSTIAWGLWYETSYKQTAPIGTGRIFLYPILTQANKVALYLPQAIDELPDNETGLATTVYVPPGYRRAFMNSLAIDLADAFGIEPKASLVTKWKLSMKRVKRSNSKAATLRLPRMLTRMSHHGRGGYNILTNQ